MNQPAPLALRCRGLTKHFAGVEAVRGVDLEVRRGECFGLLGPNGAGKTTTVEILEGLQPPTAGEIEVLGRSWRREAAAIRERIGVALQETQLADKLTVAEVLRLFQSFYRQGRPLAELLDLVDLGPKAGARVHQLSGGQRQRLAVACALVGEPELLFLDEPTTGLDPQARRRLWEVVRAYLAGGGTVVLTTHYMEEAHELCDRIAVLDGGRVIALGTPDQLIAALGAAQIVRFSVDGELEPGALTALPGVHGHELVGAHHHLRVDEVAALLPALLAELGRRGLGLLDLETHRATLDDVFLHLTGKALRDG